MKQRPVLYLSGDARATFLKLEPHFKKFNRPMMTGVLADGRDFVIIVARRPHDREKLFGREFSALVLSANPDRECIEVALSRVRS